MASQRPINENLELGAGFRRAHTISLFAGGIGLAVAIIAAYLVDPSFRRFYFAYLVSYSFFLSISLGALLFVLTQHITRAGWSVAVRRIAETLACVLPVLAALSAPIIVSVIAQRGDLYPWAKPLSAFSHVEHHDAEAPEQQTGHETPAEGAHDQAAADEHHAIVQELTLKKRAYLNPAFFLLRLFIYFTVWSVLGIYYWKWSVDQDVSGDLSLTSRMQTLSAPAILITMLTLTFGSFDLLMSLDPAWFSTMFGIYYFSGCAVAIFAALIIVVAILQRAGYLTESITTEHYHDLGKFLFAFTFFWGYIAFSQYMLLWYSAIPEEVGWLRTRGATTVSEDINAWSYVAIVLLFGHLLIPFVGLLSRHVKRRKGLLVFWAIWMLAFHWIDLLWVVMPEYNQKFHLGLIDLACLVGIGGIYLAAVLRVALRHKLQPVADPRLGESLAFENV